MSESLSCSNMPNQGNSIGCVIVTFVISHWGPEKICKTGEDVFAQAPADKAPSGRENPTDPANAADALSTIILAVRLHIAGNNGAKQYRYSTNKALCDYVSGNERQG